MEINEIAQARDDAEDEADALLRENTTSQIAAEEEGSGEESSPAPEEEQENSGSASPTDSGDAVREPPARDDTPDLAEHFRLFRPEQFRRVPDPEGDRIWEENQRRRIMQPRLPPEVVTERLVAYELSLLESYEAQFRDSEEWLRQRQEEEAAAECEIRSRHLREIAAQDEELAEDLASATDYMGDESGSEDEYDGNAPTSGSDTVMDVVFSDSSSDLDYEPEDYMMNSDAEGSDSEDMSSDYGVNERVYIDQPNDSVAIHGESSSDGLLSLAATSGGKLPHPGAQSSSAPPQEQPDSVIFSSTFHIVRGTVSLPCISL
ncbi:hypothetical protein FA13DRAFT_577477 [Coprinellus micaceus]|uniref:Uncharacterized protein n=1 Tax=Coprinellus micaceus TaxID=71717 RepID=A0A4Y7T9I1_COPMI|nr:hypothetical protein FA13DRAFT_577477 [Coprinellus micaceus]